MRSSVPTLARATAPFPRNHRIRWFPKGSGNHRMRWFLKSTAIASSNAGKLKR